MLNNGRTRFILVLAGAALAAPAAWCTADPPPYCQKDVLGTEAGSEAYAFRDGNRCEGLYRVKVSGSRKFVITSLTTSHSDSILKDQSELEVSWNRLPAGVKVRIEVVPISSAVFYRMDTEVDGAAGIFRWPAKVLRGRISRYSNLGAVAYYTANGDRIYLACVLGPAPVTPEKELRVDIFSMESLDLIEVFSRDCRAAENCESAKSGTLNRTLPGRGRGGTFTLKIGSLAPSEFHALRFVGQVAGNQVPPVARTIVLQAPLPGRTQVPGR